MFDIGWSELVIVGIVALLVVGPKELPALLRTIGRYAGIMKKQAAEFRAQFDEAMRETEIDQLKKDVESLKTETEASFRETERALNTEWQDASKELQSASLPPADAAPAPLPPQPDATPAAEHDAPAPQPYEPPVKHSGLNGVEGRPPEAADVGKPGAGA